MRKRKRRIKDIPLSDWIIRIAEEPIADYYQYPPVTNSFDYECCKHCSNNPANGGSGICYCVLPYMS